MLYVTNMSTYSYISSCHEHDELHGQPTSALKTGVYRVNEAVTAPLTRPSPACGQSARQRVPGQHGSGDVQYSPGPEHLLCRPSSPASLGLTATPTTTPAMIKGATNKVSKVKRMVDGCVSRRLLGGCDEGHHFPIHGPIYTLKYGTDGGVAHTGPCWTDMLHRAPIYTNTGNTYLKAGNITSCLYILKAPPGTQVRTPRQQTAGVQNLPWYGVCCPPISTCAQLQQMSPSCMVDYYAVS
ncbi:hypothetical protein EDD17DRAFT_913245 [Pisolithus thermaeus]|nr:hypothetical protein EDD17DRAFT_913245 [Pisolithus thermaeus]